MLSILNFNSLFLVVTNGCARAMSRCLFSSTVHGFFMRFYAYSVFVLLTDPSALFSSTVPPCHNTIPSANNVDYCRRQSTFQTERSWWLYTNHAFLALTQLISYWFNPISTVRREQPHSHCARPFWMEGMCLYCFCAYMTLYWALIRTTFYPFIGTSWKLNRRMPRRWVRSRPPAGTTTRHSKALPIASTSLLR